MSAGSARVRDEHVTGLAVPADHGHRLGPGRGMTPGPLDVIPAAVQRGPRVVAHAAVHHDEGARAALHGEHPVQRHPGRADDRASRLDGQARHRDAVGGAFLLDHGGDPPGERGDVQALVPGPVGHGVTAAEVQLGQPAQPGHEGDQAAGGFGKAVQAGDLRSEVAVHPGQFQGRQAADAAGQVRGRAGGDRQAELLVLGPGGHRRVHVGVHPRRDPDQDLLPLARPARPAARPRLTESTTTRPTP